METKDVLLREIETLKADLFSYTMDEIIQRESEIRAAADAAADLMIAEAKARANAAAEYSQVIAPAAEEKPRIRLESLKEMAAWKPNAHWLIKDHIPASGIGCFFGDPGTGKTFVAIEIGVAISTPSITEWHGFPIKQHGTAVYLSGEGNNRIRDRILGAAQYYAHGIDETDFYLYPSAVSFDKGGAAEVVAELKRLDLKPVLFVVDTLRRYLDGDENNSEDIARFLDGLESLKAEESTILVITHSGNNPETKNRVRGSSSLRGAWDFEVKISTDSHGHTKLHSTKMKDAEQPKDLFLEPIKINVDGRFEDDGTPTSTLVFCDDPAAEAEEQEAAKKERPLNHTLHALLQSFREAAEEKGELDDNGNFIGLHVEAWRKYAYAVSTAYNQTAKKTAFSRNREELVKRGYLTVKNDYYRLGPADDMPEFRERQFAEKLKQRPPKDRQLLIGEAENDSGTRATQGNKNAAETQHENTPKESSAKPAKRSQSLKKEAESDGDTRATKSNKTGAKKRGVKTAEKASEKGDTKPHSRKSSRKEKETDKSL